jgi:hypothetical protein
MYIGAGWPGCGDVCSGGRARGDDGLGDRYLAMQGVVVAALTGAGFAELRLVKVVGLPVWMDDGCSGIGESRGE